MEVLLEMYRESDTVAKSMNLVSLKLGRPSVAAVLAPNLWALLTIARDQIWASIPKWASVPKLV